MGRNTSVSLGDYFENFVIHVIDDFDAKLNSKFIKE